MSDDWAKDYIEVHKQRQQEKQDAQKKTQMAQDGAPEVFQRVLARIRQDIQTFHEAGVLLRLQLKEDRSGEKFTISCTPPSLRTTLEVELSTVLMKYTYVLDFMRNNFLSCSQPPFAVTHAEIV